MARIKLPIPKNDPHFKYHIPVRITDINYGGHLGNQVLLEYCHEARVQFFHSLGQSEKKFLGHGIIMTDSAIVYKAEAFWNETIEVQLFIAELNPYGFDLFYLLLSQQREVARVKTGIVFFDYIQRKIAKAPENLSGIFLLS